MMVIFSSMPCEKESVWFFFFFGTRVCMVFFLIFYSLFHLHLLHLIILKCKQMNFFSSE